MVDELARIVVASAIITLAVVAVLNRIMADVKRCCGETMDGNLEKAERHMRRLRSD